MTFKYILVAFILYYLWKKVGRNFFSTLSRKTDPSSHQQNKREQPKVTSYTKKTGNNKSEFSGGEYVDYEEVD